MVSLQKLSRFYMKIIQRKDTTALTWDGTWAVTANTWHALIKHLYS